MEASVGQTASPEMKDRISKLRLESHPPPEIPGHAEETPCQRQTLQAKQSRQRQLPSGRKPWNGDEQACAITAAAIRVHAAAMGQARQSLEPAFDHHMRRGSAQLGDEAHTARIMIRRKGEATLRHTTCLT